MNRRLCQQRALAQSAIERTAARGFGLLEVMLVLLIMGAALSGGFLYLKATESAREAQVQQDLLKQADRYLKGFVAKNYRLPCPATATTGVEDCTAGAVGTLPYRTLGLEGADVRTRLGQLRYTVSTDTTLTTAADNFNPQAWDGTAYSYAVTNGADFCAALETAGRVSAYTLTAASTLNASGTGIGNQTLTRRTDEISASSGCALLTMSLNTLARAVDMVGEVNQQKEDTKDAAELSTILNGIATVLAIVNTVMSGMDLAAAITVLSTAASLLATAIATCVLLVGCAEIPHAAAATVAATVAVVAAGVALAANVASTISQAVATGLAAAVWVKASGIASNNTIDMSAAIAQADATVVKAQTDLTTRQAEATAARNQANSAKTALDANWASLLSSAHSYVADANSRTNPVGTRVTTMNDALLVTVQSRANTLEQAKLDVSQAQGELEVATKKRDELVQAKVDLQTQLASETDAAKRTRLTDAITNITTQIADANTALTAAQTNLTNKQAAQTAAATALSNAEAAAVDAFCFDKTVTNTCTLVDHRGDMQVLVDYTIVVPLATPIETGYVPEYRKWFDKEQRALKAEQAATDAQAALTDATNRAAQLRTIGSGSSASGSQLTIWNGAEAILQAADAKGAMQ